MKTTNSGDCNENQPCRGVEFDSDPFDDDLGSEDDLNHY